MDANSILTVDKLKIITLVENSPKYDSYFMGCFGISFWIEIESNGCKKTILFDVGTLPEVAIHNAELMGLSFSDIDMIILSHCHFDHTAALAGILVEIGHDVPILAHPDIYRPNFTLAPEFLDYSMKGENCKDNIERLGGHYILTKSPIQPYPGILLTGEIEQTVDFEKLGGVSCYTIDSKGNLVQDRLQDDISLLINVKGKGLIVLAGCAHAGIINIMEQSIRQTGIDKIEAVIGGFHLLEAESDRVDKTLQSLERLSPNWIVPMHCTGIIPTARIATSFPERFKEIHAGDILNF